MAVVFWTTDGAVQVRGRMKDEYFVIFTKYCYSD